MSAPRRIGAPCCNRCGRLRPSVAWRTLLLCGACALASIYDAPVTHYGAMTYRAAQRYGRLM